MDALLVCIISLVVVLLSQRDNTAANEPIEELEDIEREAKVNELFYEDENAFSEIINALGFPKELK